MRKKLSTSSIRNSAIVRFKCQQRLFLTTAKDNVKPCCCSSVCYCSEFPRQLILKFTTNAQDWIALWTSESKTVILVESQKPIIWFAKLLLKFISGFNIILGLSELIVNLR